MENKLQNKIKKAVFAIDDKLGKDIKVLDIHTVSSIADYFIIASGSNKNHVHSIVDNIEELLREDGYHPKQVEGYHSANWILLDYGDMIIHIFDEENRSFYGIDKMWKDGIELSVQDLLLK